MGNKFSFLHISDIHLGRAFSDLSVYTDVMSVCNSACETAFSKIIDFAIDKKVDFVLIAGDSFDDDEHDLHTKLVFRKSLEKLADNGISSYVICGNHDPISMYKSFSSYFKFDEKYDGLINITGVTTDEISKVYTYNDYVKIHTVSFAQEEMASPVRYLNDANLDCFNIGLIHCDLDKTASKYAPCSRQDLLALGYDYYALGHIHLPTKDEDKLVYSGTVQARTKKEVDEHGFRYVCIENNKIVSSEFIPSDCVRFVKFDIDCFECENKIDVFEKINEELNILPKNIKLYLVQINLVGVTGASKDLKTNDNLLDEYLQENSNNFVAVYEINDYTSPLADMNMLKQDDGVVGIIAKNFDNNFESNFDDIYEEIVARHKKIYKSLGIDKISESELNEALISDKEIIFAKIENELKQLCSEIYED